MRAFLISLGFVFLAEMGDKTQLVSLAFAARYPAGLVLSGVFVATLLVHIISVALGQLAAFALPELWIEVAAGVAFLLFGLWTIRGDKLDDDEAHASSRLGPFLTVATTFFLAELGDKTMLTTVTVASQQKAFVPVWIGSTLGMVAADGLAIIVGSQFGKRLPERAIRIGAAVLFIATGVYTLVHALLF